MIHRPPARPLLVLGLLASPAVAAPQAVELRVLEDSARAPAAGAIVRLLDRRETAVARGLTDAAGRVTLLAPAPGEYRVRVDRIGFVAFVSGPLHLAAGDVLRQEFTVSSPRHVLPTLVAEAETACGPGARGGTLAAALWEDIRTALTANLLTQEGGGVLLSVTLFERPVSRLGRVGDERVIGTRRVSGQPFHTFPAAELARTGYVVETRDSLSYAGPDAELLLADSFVETHCFRGVESLGGELVGLRFEPVPGLRRPDIAGVLWVDRASRELRHLEYRYTGLSRAQEQPLTGGRVEFLRLPSGAWIVSDWFIRLPAYETVQVGVTGMGGSRSVVRGYRDRGGRAVPLGSAASAPAPIRLSARLEGHVFDSVAGRGLAGAVVRLEGIGDSVLTDADGRFGMDAPVGEHVLRVTHPRLGLVADRSTQLVRLGLQAPTIVTVAVPPPARFAETLCATGAGRAGLLGLALDPARPASGLTVRVTWPRVAGGHAEARTEEVASGARGVYTFCALEPGRSLTITVLRAGHPLGQMVVTLAPGEFRWLDLPPR